MQTTFFTQTNNLGRATSIPGANAAARFVGLTTADLSVWEMPMSEWVNGAGNFKLRSTDQVESPYNPEMVDLLLRLKARGPVLRFKNSREAVERLYPSKG
jgi:hypothetical protein